MMRKNKIGTVFLVAILALAGVGVSFGGLTDIITVYGTVTTGTVELVIEDYSGTWVYKIVGIRNGTEPLGEPIVYDPVKEILIYSGMMSNTTQYPGELAVKQWAMDNVGVAKLISWAQGRPWHEGDPYQPDPEHEGLALPYDAVVEFYNLFPCINFHADLVLHYIGTVPAKIINVSMDFDGDIVPLPDGTMGDWLDYLISTKDFTYKLGSSPLPEQLHYCDHLYFNVNLHIPQNNLFQGLSGTGYLTINVRQWNDLCDEGSKLTDFSLPTTPVDMKIIQTPWNQLYPPGPSTFRTRLLTVPLGDYNVENGDWVGWCVDQLYTIIVGQTYTVELWSSYDPACPYPDHEWPIVNWIINHKELWPGFTAKQMQDAIYNFVDGGPYTGTDTLTLQIIADASGHYEFVPQAGDVVAVLCWPINPTDGKPILVQKSFIEVDP